MQAVGQFDQQHADVFGHREQKFPEVFRLFRLVGIKVDPGQFGDPVDQTRDVVTEHLFQVGKCGIGIFDGVVQKRRHDGRGIDLVVGQDAGNFDRM